jgi:hypothetical protein
MIGKFLEWISNEHQEIPVVSSTTSMSRKERERLEHETGYAAGGEEDIRDDGTQSVSYYRGYEARRENDHWQSCKSLKW